MYAPHTFCLGDVQCNFNIQIQPWPLKLSCRTLENDKASESLFFFKKVENKRLEFQT